MKTIPEDKIQKVSNHTARYENNDDENEKQANLLPDEPTLDLKIARPSNKNYSI